MTGGIRIRTGFGWAALAVVEFDTPGIDAAQKNITIQKSQQSRFNNQLFNLHQRFVTIGRKPNSDPGCSQCRNRPESDPEWTANFEIHAQFPDGEFTDCRFGKKKIDGYQAEPDCGQQRYHNKR